MEILSYIDAGTIALRRHRHVLASSVMKKAITRKIESAVPEIATHVIIF